MRKLLDVKVKRGLVLDEWEKADAQNTLDGLRSLAERQEARRIAAQGKPVADNVTEILPVVRKRKP